MNSAKNSFTTSLSEIDQLSPQDYLAHIFQHFKKNQDHVTSLLLSKNDYFIRQLQKELEHDVYPMVADELIQCTPQHPPLLPQTPGRQPTSLKPSAGG